MKKIDKLILGSFLGPFILTFLVVIFILLMQFMLRYFDEIVGKDLGYDVIAQLIFYFSIFMTPNAFPLAVLLSSLMTFGNLGEHFELIALKSAGISLIRALVPIFVFSLILAAVAYYSNNYIVPKAALKAFSLLWDVKQKKPSMEIKEGAFYNGIDGYSIKINKKFPDGKTLKDIIIYDHTGGQGNRDVILADSGKMYNILNNRYLVLELFNGRSYSEQISKKNRIVPFVKRPPEPFVRTTFKRSKLVFSLASFDLKRTREDLFAGNRLMKSSKQLRVDIDSLKNRQRIMVEEIQDNSVRFFTYHLNDLVAQVRERLKIREKEFQAKKKLLARQDSLKKLQKATHAGIAAQADTAGKGIKKKSVPPKDSVWKKNEELPKIAAEKRAAGAHRKIDFTGKKYSYKNKKDGKNEKVKSEPGTTPMLSDEPDPMAYEPAVAALGLEHIGKANMTREQRYRIIDSLFATKRFNNIAISKSLSQARHVNNHMTIQTNTLDRVRNETNKFEVEYYKKLSMSVTILVMFFIGAPLGAIIKRGGLGLPVLISIAFFILFYVISMISEKWARQDVIDPLPAAWMANIILLPIGMIFLYQAKNDARLLESDFYVVMLEKLKKRWSDFINSFKLNK